jgi:hypothetical protein
MLYLAIPVCRSTFVSASGNLGSNAIGACFCATAPSGQSALYTDHGLAKRQRAKKHKDCFSRLCKFRICFACPRKAPVDARPFELRLFTQYSVRSYQKDDLRKSRE